MRNQRGDIGTLFTVSGVADEVLQDFLPALEVQEEVELVVIHHSGVLMVATAYPLLLKEVTEVLGRAMGERVMAAYFKATPANLTIEVA